MKIKYVWIMLAFGVLFLAGCSDEADEQSLTSSDPLQTKSDNVIVPDKTMQTIQDAKNMDKLLQESVDQRNKELDKY